MKFWRRYWYWIGGVIFIALSFFLALWGSSHLPRIQTLLILGWMAMLIHQIEEYGFPGGFPSIANMAILKEKKAPYSYIFNAQQCFISNVFLCYAFYIITILFPNTVWLGASQMFGVFAQLLVHGVLIHVVLGWTYNPGLGATVCLQLPLAIYYIWYVVTTMPDQAWQLWLGIPGCLVSMLIMFILPAMLFRSRKSPYPFDEEEMFGYKKDEVLKIYNNGEPSLIEKMGLHI